MPPKKIDLGRNSPFFQNGHDVVSTFSFFFTHAIGSAAYRILAVGASVGRAGWSALGWAGAILPIWESRSIAHPQPMLHPHRKVSPNQKLGQPRQGFGVSRISRQIHTFPGIAFQIK